MSGLQGQTWHDSAADRRAEMERMLRVLEPDVDRMSDWEQRFVTDMQDNLDGNDEWVPMPKQLFKARDINERY